MIRASFDFESDVQFSFTFSLCDSVTIVFLFSCSSVSLLTFSQSLLGQALTPGNPFPAFPPAHLNVYNSSPTRLWSFPQGYFIVSLSAIQNIEPGGPSLALVCSHIHPLTTPPLLYSSLTMFSIF
jgi:hypothetical protein